jgi:hypothetical protein
MHHPEKRVTCKGALRLMRDATEATEKWNTKIVVTSTTHDAFDRLSPSRASHRITRKDDGWVASTADPDRSRQLYFVAGNLVLVRIGYARCMHRVDR